MTEEAPIRITSYANKPIRHEFTDAIRELVKKGKKMKKSPRRLALPLVNKQIASESLTMVYSSNSFEFSTTRALSSFLNSTPTMRQHLVHLSLPRVDGWTDSGFSAKLPVTNLKTLTIESEAVLLRALTGLGKVNLADFVGELVPFLRRWDAANQAAGGKAKKVLGVVRFEEFKRCKQCGSSLGDCRKTSCEGVFVCGRGEKHLQEVSDVFRVGIAEGLELLL